MASLRRTVMALLAEPATRGLALDDPRTTRLRRQVIASKPLLRSVYADWYRLIAAALPAAPGEVLEVGSGAGSLRDHVTGLIASDVFVAAGVQVVLDARRLPFADAALRAIVMTDVLHHIPAPRQFFTEAARCVRPGGVIAAVEPWVTPWSRFVYRAVHHEPFEPDAAEWTLPQGGPLTAANGALPWILLVRDRSRFLAEVPEWSIERVQPFMPFRYLLSGGVSLRPLAPAFTAPLQRWLECLLEPLSRQLGMFAFLLLRRNAGTDAGPGAMLPPARRSTGGGCG